MNLNFVTFIGSVAALVVRDLIPKRRKRTGGDFIELYNDNKGGYPLD